MGNKAVKGAALKPKEVAKYTSTGCESRFLSARCTSLALFSHLRSRRLFRRRRRGPHFTSHFSPSVPHAVTGDEVQALFGQFLSLKGSDAGGESATITLA